MAATAGIEDATFVTRNTSDIARTGVRLLNSFDLLAWGHRGVSSCNLLRNTTSRGSPGMSKEPTST